MPGFPKTASFKRTSSEPAIRDARSLRPSAPHSGIDSQALRERLTTLAEDKNGADTSVRDAVKDLLIQTLASATASARQQFEEGLLDGLETARLLASIHDDIVSALFDFTTIHVVRVSNPTDAEHLCLCAVGGYGRGEMAPGSDLDLLFLINDKKGSAFTENVTEYMLYMLWDLGLKIGHSTRTAEQCVLLAKEDQTILTALLDLRFLSGDRDLCDALIVKFRKDVTKGRGRKYIKAKLAERDARHEREGNSRYVIEPNIKEGKGGLRDLHVLYWISRFLDKEGKITDPQRASSYVDMGLFNPQAADRFVRAADFLWRARIHLHYSDKRPTETLSFDRQTILARKMGYASGPIEEAVEKFMREYFTNAREVGALTRIACAKLEADQALTLPAGLERLLPRVRRRMKEDGFKIDNGRLNFQDPLQIRKDPGLVLRLFEVAGRYNIDIHPDAFSAINFRQNIIDHDFRRDPANVTIFKDILLQSKAPAATLKLMNESGVLGRYVLEFGGIVARTQFNMHHAYTVDEHTLRLVSFLHDLKVGQLESENPIATEIVQSATKNQLYWLYLACLLHDTGKGVGDQCVEGARLARRACRRMGVAQDGIETIAWLVHSHLDLSETAQRRDISDPETIAAFGKGVGSIERLKLLYVLTVVDIRGVGPGIWNDWKGALLKSLYESTYAYLEGHTELAPAAKSLAIQAQLKERLPGDLAARIAPFFEELGDDYWTSFNMADLVRHTRFFDDIIKEDVKTLVHTRLDRTHDITELWVTSPDRERLFADLTLAISACGASIIGARLHTGKTGRVMNVFYLQNPEGLAFGRENDFALKSLRERARKAAAGDIERLRIPAMHDSRRAGAIPVKPKVKFINTASGHTSIIEVDGRDRPGLLYGLGAALYESEVYVLSAHIENIGERAIDAFYVTNLDGGPLSKAQKKQVKLKLMATLSPPNLLKTAG